MTAIALPSNCQTGLRKSEIRNPKSEGNPNRLLSVCGGGESSSRTSFISCFGFRISFGLRTSDFGLRISLAVFALLLAAIPASAQTKTNAPISTPRQSKPDFSSFKLITDRNIFSPNRTPSRPMRYESRSSTPQQTYRRGDYFTLTGTMEYEKGSFAFFDGTSSEYRKVLKPREKIGGYTLTQITQNHVRLSQETNTVELKVGMQMRHKDEGGWVAITPTDTSIGSPSYTSTSASSYGRSSSFQWPSQRGQPTPTPSVNGSTPASQPSPGGDGQQVVMMTEDGTAVVLPPGEQAGQQPGSPAAPGSTNSATIQTTTTPAPASAGSEDEVLRRLMQRREQEMNR